MLTVEHLHTCTNSNDAVFLNAVTVLLKICFRVSMINVDFYDTYIRITAVTPKTSLYGRDDLSQGHLSIDKLVEHCKSLVEIMIEVAKCS